MGVLVQEENTDADYILKKQSDYTWITVNNISIHIVRKANGLRIRVYPLDYEDGDCITETWTTWGEARGVVRRNNNSGS